MKPSVMNRNAGTVVDLFCGAGGLSCGMAKCGFDHILAVDSWPEATETYRSNLGGTALCQPIDADMDLPNADVFVGGPPCQGFSSAGLRTKGDDRNSLVGVYATLIARHRPLAFVFENVEGFLTSDGGTRVLELLCPLVDAGYRIHLRKINAANYGLGQHRKRVIAMGSLYTDPVFPEPTHSAFGAPGAGLVGSELPVTATLREVIGNMPSCTTGVALPLLNDHFCNFLNGEDLERAKLLKPGQRMRDLPESLQHDSYARRANRRVKDGTPSERRGGAPAGVRRLLWDEPSKTITSGSRHEFLHPDDHRTLSLRECARIQSFPDSYEFAGSTGDRALQIGNAVPPLMGKIIGAALCETLERVRNVSVKESGKLLSFVPTLSEGMSPALQKTVIMVKAAFEHTTLRKRRQGVLWH